MGLVTAEVAPGGVLLAVNVGSGVSAGDDAIATGTAVLAVDSSRGNPVNCVTAKIPYITLMPAMTPMDRLSSIDKCLLIRSCS